MKINILLTALSLTLVTAVYGDDVLDEAMNIASPMADEERQERESYEQQDEEGASYYDEQVNEPYYDQYEEM